MAESDIKIYRHPKTIIARFVAKRSIKSAALCAFIAGGYVASKTLGFAKLYPTVASRAKLAASLSNNVGLTAMLGKPHDITSVAGYTAWNGVGVVAILLSIWALLLATKTFRSEEDSGRWELLVSGQTTLKRATVNALAGLSATLVVLYAIMAACFILIGQSKSVNYSVSAALFFALTTISAAAIFMAVGTLMSQIVAPRSRASTFAAGIFGLFFIIRAVADITSLNWLLYITPFGWIEKLQPLYASQPIWLVPIFALVILLMGISVYLAGKRDLGDSILADKDTSKPHTRLLNGLISSSLRLTRVVNISWLMALTFASFFYGLLTKSAVQAINQSASTHHKFSKILHASSSTTALIFLGIVFFIDMLVIMSFVANSVGKLRDEEAEGYLDNILVRPISRLRWLATRSGVIIVVVLVLSLAASFGSWLGESSQSVGIAFHPQLLAGLNIIAPAIFTLGFAILALGFVPRITSFVGFVVIGWSFLIQMLSSGLNLSHFILNTSVLYHVALAPAVAPNWHSNLILGAIGVGLGIIGAIRFNSRDLASE